MNERSVQIAYLWPAILGLGIFVIPAFVAPKEFLTALPSLLVSSGGVAALLILFSGLYLAATVHNFRSLTKPTRSFSFFLSALVSILLLINFMAVWITFASTSAPLNKLLGSALLLFLWGYAFWLHYRFISH